MQKIFDKSNRRLLFIAPSAYPLGGVATWLDYIVPGLRGKGWNVTLGLVDGKFHSGRMYLDLHPDSEVLLIPYGTGTEEGRVRQLVRAIRKAKPDVVISVHIGETVAAINRIREKSKWSPRVVMAFHALDASEVASAGIESGVLDAVICTNKLLCELLTQSTSIEPKRIHYAPCGVETGKVGIKERRHSKGILRLAHVGRLQRRQKQIEDIAPIVAQLNRRGIAYELMIAGNGPDEGWLRNQLEDETRCGRVHFLGTLNDSELERQVYCRADALLITSFWETGPIVAWEAMASQVVVVTSAYLGSGVEGSLKSGENCLMFPIGDAVAACDCLEKVLDPNLRRHLLQGALALVSQRYSQLISIEQWNSALAQVAENQPLSFASRPLNAQQSSPSGRLDKVFGRYIGETIREMLGLTCEHRYPSEEWPEIGSVSRADEETFWQLAASLDRKTSASFTNAGRGGVR